MIIWFWKYSSTMIFTRPSVFLAYCTTTAHSLQSTLEYKWASSPSLLLGSFPSSLPSSSPLIFFCFVHSYNSWAVLSHTRLLRISEDADSDDDGEYVDDYDDGSNHVFWMSCFYFEVAFFLSLSFSSFVFQKRPKTEKKKRCKVLFLNYV